MWRALHTSWGALAIDDFAALRRTQGLRPTSGLGQAGLVSLYLCLRWVHVSAVICSGALFATRALAQLAGSTSMMRPGLRYLSYAIDTVLLGAAISLAVLTRQAPFVQGWLTMKLSLLVLYIVLGSYALKRGRTRRIKALAFFAAVVVFLFIVSVALAHDARGVFTLAQ